MTRNKWLAFNIAMPEQLIPIYDFLQNELNEILSDDYYRNQLESLDLSAMSKNTPTSNILLQQNGRWVMNCSTLITYLLLLV